MTASQPIEYKEGL
jgi:hypothetical protein